LSIISITGFSKWCGGGANVCYKLVLNIFAETNDMWNNPSGGFHDFVIVVSQLINVFH